MVIAAPLVYVLYVLPPSILNWYSSAAPVEPPEPAAPVTVPVLKPEQIIVPVAGDAALNAGAAGVDAIVQVLIVFHEEFEQPQLPDVLRDWTITLVVAPVVVIAAPLV